MLKFYNTLHRKKEVFKPLKGKKAGIYTCGPTVYWFAHIGNLRTYLFEDVLKRVLEYNGYNVKHVMNITDVGHLTSDSDTGEDKLEKGAKREKKTVWEIAEFYTKAFKKDLKLLNIKEPNIWIKATDTIKEQIELIKILEKKGFTYTIKDGVYFNTAKLKTYGRLWGTKKKKLKAAEAGPETEPRSTASWLQGRQICCRARVKMVAGKKNPTDFALWKFSPKGEKRQMEWKSPWEIGFPGWHTECVVMGIKNLGIPFDIHCGGIDHIQIHHTNEIAQAEAAYNKSLAKYWLHGEFLILEKGKMAKSQGNIVTVDSLVKKDLNPLAYRYLCLGCHYRSKLTFSWEAIKGAENSLKNLYEKIKKIKKSDTNIQIHANNTNKIRIYQKQFLEFIQDDLNMPKALALMWKVAKAQDISNAEKHKLLLDFDKIFGLGLGKIKKTLIPEAIKKLANEREECRKQKNWQKSDEIRKEIEKQGYSVEDTPKGPKVKKT